MVVATLLATFVVVPAAGAVPINVTTADDLYGGSAGSCSLREAVTAAQTNVAFDGCAAGSGVDAIKLPGGVYKITRAGAGENANLTGDFDITGTDALSVEAADGTAKVEVNGNGLDRVFDQQGNNAVSFNFLHVTNGLLTLIEDGGGIRNNTGTMSINSSTISDSKSAHSAGGIAVYNNLTMINSTVSGNSADGNAGGIYVPGGSLATVRSSTITKNTADANADGSGEGGGFNDSVSTSTNFFNVINAANTDSSPVNKSPDCYSGPTFFPRYVVTTQALGAGNCLVGFNPPGLNKVVPDALIGPLQDNGGQTPAHALLLGSPAIGAGSDGSVPLDACPAVDQTGRTRPAGTCDIGAVQYVEPPPPVATLLIDKIGPQKKKVKRGKTIKIKLRILNGGNGAAQGVKACLALTAKNSKKALKIKGPKCKTLGTLDAGAVKFAVIKVQAKKKAKKKSFKVVSSVVGTGLQKGTRPFNVKVK